MRAKEEEFRSTCFGSLVPALPEEGFTWKRTARRAASTPPPDPASDPAKVETVMSTALAAGISPEAALNSENQVILGSQWVRTERSLMGVSQVFTDWASLGEPNWSTSPWLHYLDRILFHLPPSSSTDRVYSASTADLNRRRSLNKYNHLENTLLFINFHSV